jgi:hypothetical protein
VQNANFQYINKICGKGCEDQLTEGQMTVDSRLLFTIAGLNIVYMEKVVRDYYTVIK